MTMAHRALALKEEGNVSVVSDRSFDRLTEKIVDTSPMATTQKLKLAIPKRT